MSVGKSVWVFGAAMAAAGVVVGGMLGWAVRSASPPTAAPFALPVQAATAQNFDNFAVATGPVSDQLEAFYFLDFLTGDLRAAVLNTRRGEFGGFFEYNIAQDFDIAGSKNPKYLMVTGTADIPRGRGNTQIARSVVYITDATSGQMAAFVMPWNSSSQAAGREQTGTFLKIANVQLRTTFVRDE